MKTVHKSVQAWLVETEYEDMEVYSRNVTFHHQRPVRISRRIERAVGMNVTDRWAAAPYQAD